MFRVDDGGRRGGLIGTNEGASFHWFRLRHGEHIHAKKKNAWARVCASSCLGGAAHRPAGCGGKHLVFDDETTNPSRKVTLTQGTSENKMRGRSREEGDHGCLRMLMHRVYCFSSTQCSEEKSRWFDLRKQQHSLMKWWLDNLGDTPGANYIFHWAECLVLNWILTGVRKQWQPVLCCLLWDYGWSRGLSLWLAAVSPRAPCSAGIKTLKTQRASLISLCVPLTREIRVYLESISSRRFLLKVA